MPVEVVDLEEQLRRAIARTETQGDDPPAWRDLAEALHDLGHVERAIEVARRTIELAPSDAAGHYLLGRILAQAGRHAEAAWSFSAAGVLAPATSGLAMDHALALEQDGRVEEASHELRQALALDPGHADAHTLLARLLFDQGDAEEALDHVRAAALLEPDSAEGQVRLGYVLEQLGRSDEARECYEVAAGWTPRCLLGSALEAP